MQLAARLPPEPTAPSQARRLAAAALEQAGVGARPEVLLVVSELVTNAVTHGGTDVEVAVAVDGRCVHVEVTDAGEGLPTVRRPDPAEPTGRGVFLVDQFAESWGTTPRPDGKVVWCRVPI